MEKAITRMFTPYKVKLILQVCVGIKDIKGKNSMGANGSGKGDLGIMIQGLVQTGNIENSIVLFDILF